ncbi:MAG: hypothetical protein KDG50_09555 [Chromatiales bacterium]|nr:hypothetical protein [Chromatiales bacterium]
MLDAIWSMLRPLPYQGEVKLLASNSVYRITDIVLRKGLRWQRDRDTILADRQYSGTILRDYLCNMRRENDWETWRNVVSMHCKHYAVPPPDSLVIHLRLGDVMDDWENDDHSRHFSRAVRAYARLPLQRFPGVKSATIVTAMHFGSNDLNLSYYPSKRAVRRSLKLLRLVAEQLKQQGVSVRIQSSTNIDEDLCYMASAHQFLGGMSGLSDLVERCLPADAVIASIVDGGRES